MNKRWTKPVVLKSNTAAGSLNLYIQGAAGGKKLKKVVSLLKCMKKDLLSTFMTSLNIFLLGWFSPLIVLILLQYNMSFVNDDVTLSDRDGYLQSCILIGCRYVQLKGRPKTLVLNSLNVDDIKASHGFTEKSFNLLKFSWAALERDLL